MLFQKACILSAGWVVLGHPGVEEALRVLPRCGRVYLLEHGGSRSPTPRLLLPPLTVPSPFWNILHLYLLFSNVV